MLTGGVGGAGSEGAGAGRLGTLGDGVTGGTSGRRGVGTVGVVGRLGVLGVLGAAGALALVGVLGAAGALGLLCVLGTEGRPDDPPDSSARAGASVAGVGRASERNDGGGSVFDPVTGFERGADRRARAGRAESSRTVVSRPRVAARVSRDAAGSAATA
jgi:hypothetical protein